MKLLRSLWAASPLLTGLALSAVLLQSLPAQSAPIYNFTPITDKWSGINGTTKMNNNGHILWQRSDPQTFPDPSIISLQIYKNGNSTSIISSTTVGQAAVDFNNQDQAVWQQPYYFSPSVHKEDIYLYSNGPATQLTFAASDLLDHTAARINNQGTIIWVETGASITGARIAGAVALNVPGGIDGSPCLNDRNEIVWSGKEKPADTYLQIFYWHGGSPEKLTDDDFEHKAPVINNQGDIVWAKATPSGYELWLRHSGTSQKIGSNVSSWFPYVLNDQGQVAWINTTGRLYLYSGGTNHEISTDSFADETIRPAINYRGQVLYQTYSLSQLALYTPGTGTAIIQDSMSNRHDLQLTDNGLVFWSSSGIFDHRLYLGSPPGLNQPPITYLLLGD
jgi:hypothetical protein